MIIYYRLSDGSYKKDRFEFATKENCLKNFLNQFYAGDRIYLYLDNVQDTTFEKITKIVDASNANPSVWNIECVRSSAGSSAASFRLVFEEALKQPTNEIIYFVEDDYLHLPHAREVLIDGLRRADYVTLYNHPDKYIPASKGGNKFIGEDAAETTKVTLGTFSYWMLTNSTTMTFASTVNTLLDDAEIWRKYIQGTYPRDFDCFVELRHKGKSLLQPIPTFSTHIEKQWSASLIGTNINSWREVI